MTTPTTRLPTPRKLYDNRFAPSPRRVRMFAAEKGLTIPRVEIDLGAGANQQTEFLAINPQGEVPVLELDDGTRLTESLAICRYLEALQPEPNLLGRDPLEAARIESEALRLMFQCYVPTTQAFRHTHRYWADRLKQVPEYGAQAREQVLERWQALDRDLASREWLTGERFTLADIVAFTTLEFGKPSGIRLQPEQVNLKRWYEQVASRASASA
ncbi:MAG: glutathione S-transferase family protein [Sinobacteraceae bacterium]|nr:glutathione S-transferase family protein [Nevskiaceae bacterium]